MASVYPNTQAAAINGTPAEPPRLLDRLRFCPLWREPEGTLRAQDEPAGDTSSAMGRVGRIDRGVET